MFSKMLCEVVSSLSQAGGHLSRMWPHPAPPPTSDWASFSPRTAEALEPVGQEAAGPRGPGGPGTG